MASDLVLHCLPVPNRKNDRLIWVNEVMQLLLVHYKVLFVVAPIAPIVCPGFVLGPSFDI